MYANLEVKLTRRIIERSTPEVLHAWKVEISPGVASIYLDANDGQSNYAKEAGTREIDLNEYRMDIVASF